VKGDLVTDSQSILARWRNHGVDDVRQTEIHTAESLVPEPSAFEDEMAIEKLKKTPIIRYFQTPKRIKTRGRTTFSVIY
jgi:hypothetical protein